MDLEMVLNELSLTPAPDIPTARQWMSNLISTLVEATANKLAKRVLHTHIKIDDIEIAPDYPVSRWRNDKEVDREKRRFLGRLQTKYPVCKDAAEKIENDFYLSDVWHQGKKTIGLRFAWASDALPVSLLSEPKWDCSHLLLKLQQLDDEEFTDIKLEHASRPIHVKEHADSIKERIRTGVRNGSDMWNRRDELFPHLEFCDRVCKQMQALRTGDPMLGQVKQKLFELEESSKNWASGSKLDSLLGKPSTQGQGTLEQYEKKHTFRCPDGVERIFSLHLRITKSWRLHFSTELGPGKIIVGHIGDHRPTKKYPT